MSATGRCRRGCAGLHACEVAARQREPAGRAAEGQQQLRVVDPAAVGQRDLVRAAVDAVHRDAEAQVDPLLVVPGGRVDKDRVPGGRAREVGLGQRRALVGSVLFGAQQHDLAVEALGSQRLGGFGSGQARSDDHMSLVRGPGQLLVCAGCAARSALSRWVASWVQLVSNAATAFASSAWTTSS
jgi:hypothetical protein